jgi:hypothetical protein
MSLTPRIRRRAVAALGATALLVMASVGSCHLPQPRLPELGVARPDTTPLPATGARTVAAARTSESEARDVRPR